MAFGENLELLLPSYLIDSQKSRLKDALSQFVNKDSNEINYTDFYREFNHSYFLQSDLVREIRFAEWEDNSATFIKAYTQAIIISNTCDISFENKRSINSKQCLLAPLVDFQDYLNDLESNGYNEDQILAFSKNVRYQLSTNIFYLPQNHIDNREYIVLLDNIFWFPTEELNSYINEIQKTRITSLSHFGFYLFILKLSYHLCRLPEQCDRAIN
jgi:hypothetical protein